MSVPASLKAGKENSRLQNYAYTASLVAAVLAWIILSGFTNAPPHKFTNTQCGDCHAGIPAPGEPRPYVFKGSINDLCAGCHEGLEVVSHKLCVVPSFEIQSSLPLEKGCGITCATCHEPHMAVLDPDTGEETHMLRPGVAGKNPCDSCHGGEYSNAHMQTHRPSMDRAHGYADFKVVDFGIDLDPLTFMCLGCHDRPDYPERTEPGSELWRHGNNTFVPHVVGVDYDELAWDNRNLRLADRDESLPLFDGKIGCGTCHDPYRPGGGLQLRLKDGEDKSMLCMGCHLDK